MSTTRRQASGVDDTRRRVAAGTAVLLVALAMVFVAPQPAHACSCPPVMAPAPPGAKVAPPVSYQAFSGTVLASETTWSDDGPIHYSGHHDVTFSVEDVQHGALEPGTQVVLRLSAGQEPACSFSSAPAAGETRYVRIDGSLRYHDGRVLGGGICDVSFATERPEEPATIRAPEPPPAPEPPSYDWLAVLVASALLTASVVLVMERGFRDPAA